jgi:hypothetical protein
MKRIFWLASWCCIIGFGTAHAQTTKGYSATITVTGVSTPATCTGFAANCASGHCTCSSFAATVSGNQVGKGSGTLLINVDFGNTMGGTPDACVPFFALLPITNGTKDPTEDIGLQGDVCNNPKNKKGPILGGFGFGNTSAFVLGWGKLNGTGLVGNTGAISQLNFKLAGHVDK